MNTVDMVCQMDVILSVNNLDMVLPDELREHVDNTIPDGVTTLQLLQGYLQQFHHIPTMIAISEQIAIAEYVSDFYQVMSEHATNDLIFESFKKCEGGSDSH
jgi:hypothetical protein